MKIFIKSKTFCYEEVSLEKGRFEIYFIIYGVYSFNFQYKFKLKKLTILHINDIINGKYLYTYNGLPNKYIKFYYS
jgi:hypothetical protein